MLYSRCAHVLTWYVVYMMRVMRRVLRAPFLPIPSGLAATSGSAFQRGATCGFQP